MNRVLDDLARAIDYKISFWLGYGVGSKTFFNRLKEWASEPYPMNRAQGCILTLVFWFLLFYFVISYLLGGKQ